MRVQVAQAFDQAGLSSGDYNLRPKPGPPTALRTFLGPDRVLTVAIDDDGRRLNLIEVQCRRWAREIGVPCPEVVSASEVGDWILAERVEPLEAHGEAYVHAALDAADRIGAASPPTLDLPSSTWRAPRRTVPVRALRSALGGLGPGTFLRARRAASSLAATTTSHGDFYRRNVLRPGVGGVSIVDWEFIGTAPRFADHLRLWSTLRDASDRTIAWQRILAGVPAADQADFRTLATWMTIRLLAENLAAPRRQRNPQDLMHARLMSAEGLRLTGR